MRQGRMQRLALVALAGVLLVGIPGSGHAVVRETAAGPKVAKAARGDRQADPGARAARAANGLKQFTGYVSAVDKSSITVEKRGKKPETRVFEKLDEMKTTGDVAKDARVTVFYREEGGRSVAHRVVVKPARAGSKSGSASSSSKSSSSKS